MSFTEDSCAIRFLAFIVWKNKQFLVFFSMNTTSCLKSIGPCQAHEANLGYKSNHLIFYLVESHKLYKIVCITGIWILALLQETWIDRLMDGHPQQGNV